MLISLVRSKIWWTRHIVLVARFPPVPGNFRYLFLPVCKRQSVDLSSATKIKGLNYEEIIDQNHSKVQSKQFEFKVNHCF